ncbi:MAG TPA: propanediol utilization protein [Sporichthyaceae bacterium]|jgi:hypothetical protein
MGGGYQYSVDDEGSHSAGPDPWWQESVFVHWYDATHKVGGVHRIGHEPHANGGEAAVQCFVFDAYSSYRRVGRVPLLPAETERGFRAAGSTWDIEDGLPRVRVKEDGLELDLRIDNFYPLTDFFPSSGSMVDDFAKHHYETSGRARGTASINGREYVVDALCHRDHSWGPRRWDMLLSHRWVSGSLGPELSFGSMAWHAIDDSTVSIGYIVREGELILAESVDIVTFMETDAMTHRGGILTLNLPGGEQLRAHCTVVNGVVTTNHGVYWVDSLCEVTMDDGRTGFCDFEISTNPRAGTREVKVAKHAAINDGWS